MTRNNRRSRRSQNRVQAERQVDPYSGNNGLMVDRMISNAQNRQSTTTLICGDYFGLTGGTAEVDRNISYQDIVSTDDFQSMAAQFNEFRVLAIRFDVYNINSSINAFSAFSTFHTETLGRSPSVNITTVIDRPDSQVVSAGTGHIPFTWVARGSAERAFQEIIAASSVIDYGGLSGSIGPLTASAPAFQIVMKAVVQFRGRI